MVIEKEFQNAMATAWPAVAKDSLQFKSARLTFYMGAYTMVTSRALGDSEDMLLTETKKLKDALALASNYAKDGVQPEDTLADYIEHLADSEPNPAE